MPRQFRQVLAWAFALAVVAGVTTFAQTSAGRTALRKLGLAGSSALTELAFAHPAALPTSLPSPEHPITLVFDVANLSRRTRTYHWSIIAESGRERSRVAGGGIISLSPGATETITARARLGCRARTYVSVRLGASESIGFWAACSAPPRRPAGRSRPPAPGSPARAAHRPATSANTRGKAKAHAG